jgi:hypothetical protein
MADRDPIVHLSHGGMSSLCGERGSFCWAPLEKAVSSGAACPICLAAIRPAPIPVMLMVLVIPIPVPMPTPPATPPERSKVIDVQEVRKND